ncbi:MAG: sigma-70 family RNA polymerase sigma factor [Candidatus Promineifilaceae bacterium]
MRGQLDAFTMLYERHLPSVYNRVRYRIPESDVEDVTQEVFITALRSLKHFKGTAQFSTWLRTLTNRRVADFYRNKEISNRHSEPFSSESERFRMEELSVPSKNAASDDRIVLREALLRLPDHYQEILLLRFADGMKFKEIAKDMGQSLEATKSLYRRALQALRETVGEINV